MGSMGALKNRIMRRRLYLFPSDKLCGKFLLFRKREEHIVHVNSLHRFYVLTVVRCNARVESGFLISEIARRKVR